MHTKRVCPSYEIVTGPIHLYEVALEQAACHFSPFQDPVQKIMETDYLQQD